MESCNEAEQMIDDDKTTPTEIPDVPDTNNESSSVVPEEVVESNKNSRVHNIRFRWKGKIVKESTYKHKMAIREGVAKRKLAAASQIKEDPKIPVEGRRIVDLQLLANHLRCTMCKEVLSLENTESETRRGLASILHVRCVNCSLIRFVPTSNSISDKDTNRSKLYTVNSEVVNGATQAGMTCNRLNKLLSCLNIPQVQWKLFQRYKHEATPLASLPNDDKEEKSDFCMNAALETAETVENSDAIQEMLAELF